MRIDTSEFTHEADATASSAPRRATWATRRGGRLTEAIRRRPYAPSSCSTRWRRPPRTFDLFLQVLEDGRLTDGQGRTVNFRNTVGAHDHESGQPGHLRRGGDPAQAEAAVQAALHAHFARSS
ncbi:MAG: AAA family ATPase [Holophagaceae bacterium]|uniref:AAA family ATPase n=1 Tax=Candidatus Geothrix odensensis TaxID=2954440 RepID=A0A936F3Y4_9BACT|nr:AAA family ATPase [Candidatus Geothrix odensensis]